LAASSCRRGSPLQNEGGELLFDVLSARHERAATIITFNLAFCEWNRVFGDDQLTAALLDRLAHNLGVERAPHAVLAQEAGLSDSPEVLAARFGTRLDRLLDRAEPHPD
jgi:hypothetical protein